MEMKFLKKIVLEPIYAHFTHKSFFFQNPLKSMKVACSVFILLSRESDGSAIFWTNPHLLRRVFHF